MHMALFADAGPGPLLLPMGGSVLLAGLVLSLAFVTGGIWITRRVQDQPALLSRKFCLLFLAGAMWSAAILPAVIGLFEPAFFLAVIALFGVGGGLILLAYRSPKATPAPENDQR